MSGGYKIYIVNSLLGKAEYLLVKLIVINYLAASALAADVLILTEKAAQRTARKEKRLRRILL